MNSSIETNQSAGNLPNNNVTLIYILYLIGFVFGITYLVGGIMAFIKKGDEAHPLLKSHYSYQASTFLWSVVWAIVGFATAVIVVGYVVLIVNYIWALYRVIKGWLAFNGGKSLN